MNRVSGKVRTFPFILVGVGVAFFVSAGNGAAGAVLLLGALLAAIALWVDRYRRSVAIVYAPSGVAAESAGALERSVAELKQCSVVWAVKSEGVTADWKRNAGANRLNDRKLAQIGSGRPQCLRGSASFPSIGFGTQTLFFLPDATLFVEGKSVTALHYRDLEIAQQSVRFIEEEPVPCDASVVGQTWRFVNKNGGPDRRFNNNRQLPVCLYSEVDLRSAGGLHGRLQLSRQDAGAAFGRVVQALGQHLDTDDTLRPIKSYRVPKVWPTLALSGFAAGYILGVIAMVAPPRPTLTAPVQAPQVTSLSAQPAPKVQHLATPVVIAPRVVERSMASKTSNNPLVIIPPSVIAAPSAVEIPVPHQRPASK